MAKIKGLCIPNSWQRHAPIGEAKLKVATPVIWVSEPLLELDENLSPTFSVR